MLNKEQKVQVCDATNDHSSTKARQIIFQTLFSKIIHRLHSTFILLPPILLPYHILHIHSIDLTF